MKVRAAVIVMGALLALYLLFAIYYGLLLIGTGEPIAVAIGVALLVLPAIAFGFMIAEILFAVRAQGLAKRLEAEGALPDEQLPLSPSGRVERERRTPCSRATSPMSKQHPDDWRAWFRLALAYDASGDRRRARWATRQAIKLSRA